MKFKKKGARYIRGHGLSIVCCLFFSFHAQTAFAARLCPDGTTAPPSNICPEPEPDPIPVRYSDFLSQGVPTTMVVGQSYGVSLSYKNTGSTTWTAGAAFNLGSQNPGDNTTWGTHRVATPGSVAYNQSVAFNWTAVAPRTPGTYNFQWRMVQDGVAWFGQSSTNVSIQVLESVIKGNIDGISGNVISGWACSTRLNASIDVHLYLGGTAGSSGSVMAGVYQANQASEPGVASSCQAGGAAYRFYIPVTNAMVTQYGGQAIYVHGISPVGASNSAISGSGSFLIPVNAAPTAQLTAPGAGSIIAEGGTFTLAANASDADDGVASVAFIGDGNVVASSNSTPYQSSWSSVPEGAHTLAVRATDTRGASFTSSSTIVYASRVIGDIGQPDSQHIWGWACSTYVGSSIDVHFYAGGPAGSGTLIGVYTANRASGQDVAAACKAQGTAYMFDIPVTDDLVRQHARQAIYIHGISPVGGGNNVIGHSGSYTVPQNQVPSVTLTSPTSDPGLQAPASIQMTASASDPDDAVAKVEFLSNDQVAGTATTAPYQYTLSGLAYGSYRLRAVATDRRGAQTTSATVTINVNAAPESPASVTRSYVYDQYQRLCKTIEPESGATVVDYDAADNVVWSASGLALPSTANCDRDQVPDSVKVVRTYTPRNQVDTVAFPDGMGTQVFTYTPDGLVEAVATYNSAGGDMVVNSYMYNHRRLMTLERLEAAGSTTDYAYGYDSNGNLASNSRDGVTVDYAPNALGQPTRAGSFATGVSYWPNGAIKQFTYGNGIVHTMQQNARQLPERSTDAVGDVRPLDSGYAYDANGNVRQIADYTPGGHRSVSMAYDGLDRLTYASSPMFGTAAYDYDPLDNLISQQVSGGNSARNYWYVYSAQNRLASVTNGPGGATVVGLDYDARGNLSNKNGVLYGFDTGNRLRSVSGSKGAYLYDGQGRRVLDTVNGIAKHSQYSSGGQLVLASDARTSIVSDYVYLGGSLVAIRERNAAGGAYTDKYQHTDALGSPVAVTDQSRAVIETSDYEPYGKLVNRAEKDGPGFTGHVQDAATGMTYMQQRYYDPGIGKMLSVDPVTAYGGDMRHFNVYAYAYNNPYKFTDPDGRCPMGCPGDIQPTIEDSATILGWAADGLEAVDQFMTALGPQGSGLSKLSVAPLARMARPLAAEAKAAAQLAKNVAQGAKAEAKVAAEMGAEVAGKRVTLEASTGQRSVADIVTTNKGVVEVKSGGAQLSSGQKAIKADIEAGRPVTPRGANAEKAGLEAGKATQMKCYDVKRC